MKKILGITFGGIQKKLIRLVAGVLLVTIIAFAFVASFQNRMLTGIVEETREEQQQAISRTSEQTMKGVLQDTFVRRTSLYAQLADSDFSEVVNDVYMLKSMAEGLWENRDSVAPAQAGLPDPEADGTVSAMVLHEEGVDYTQSKYLPVVAHMTASMIAMVNNTNKINGCYIGLADGVHLGVDMMGSDKYDENGELIPFPVRERPWYRGAVETGGLFFTGIERDAFSGELGISCSVPVEADGEFIGVVGIDIVLDNMDDMISSSNISDGFVFIVNNNGQVVLTSAEKGLFTAEESDQAEDLRENSNRDLALFVGEALVRTTALTTIEFGGKEYYMAGAPMPTVGWTVISAVSKELTESPEKQMLAEYDKINEASTETFRSGTSRTMFNIVLIILFIMLIGSAAALIAAHRISRPIEQMTKEIYDSSITGEPFCMKNEYRTDDEIETLAETFAELSWKTRKYINDITEITKEKERVSTELHMANRIQASMLPSVFPAYPDRKEFDIYASMQPAREVGGDFYDFFLIDEDHLGIVMADVSGKGIPAALFMMISKVILQSCAMLGRGAAEILTKTNEAICSSNPEEMFVTVWLGILEISTGRITAANAGHEYPAIKKDGKFYLIKDRHGLVIGGMPITRYKEYEIQMEPGDKLFVYTDGVPEATDEDGKMFGTNAMLEALNRDPSAAPEEILKNVHSAVDDFVEDAEQFDDITMLCLEYKGPVKEN